jgi:TRAP-type mannitol/chloroaromatic compound transport system permease small subunit
VLPQVLAGLGLLSLFSAGCLFWLERLAPLFFTVAVGSLVYQVWAVSKRPAVMRTWAVKAILTVSLVLNVLVIGGWIVLAIRYR